MRIQLKLKNETLWSTRDLRRFLIAGMRAKGIERLTAEIGYGREHWTGQKAAHGGRASLWRPWLRLTLPGPKWVAKCQAAGTRPIDYLELAQVLEHEIDHTLGLEHKDMREWWDLRPTWQEGLVITWVPPAKPEPMAPEVREERRRAALSASAEKRAAHARRMLKRAEARLKRARTIYRGWVKKVAYYDRRDAARAAAMEET